MRRRDWQDHESYIQQVLGLGSTVTSGNKWWDPGDAVTRGCDSPFPLYADCKATEKGSFSLRHRDLADLNTRADELGKRMVMPIRFVRTSPAAVDDYILLSLHDFVELMTLNGGRGD